MTLEKDDTCDKKSRGNFFLIDVGRAVAAAKRSMNEGLAYLILASGTLADNRTTCWSTTAVAHYAGIGVEHAKAAIQRLLSAGDIALSVGSTTLKPKYKFEEISEKKAWLPCSLIDWGSGSYVSILKRIRATGDNVNLAFFIELYGEQNLAKNRGLSRDLIHSRFQRKKIGEFEEFDIWAFGGARATGLAHSLSPYLDDDSTRLVTLFDIGALEWARYIFESDDAEAEPVLPVTEFEEQCANDERRALIVTLLQATSGQKKLKAAEKSGFWIFMMAKRHQKHLVLYEVARLTHRPKTGNSARFVAHDKELLEMSEKVHTGIRKRYEERLEKAAFEAAVNAQ